jgi:antirestriction protein ArdC
MTRRVEDKDGERARVVTGFKAVPVFDIAQTDGEPLPEIATRLQGSDEQGSYTALIAVAHGLGYTVEEDNLPGEKNGDCNFVERRIRVEVRNAPAQQLKTVAHELAHAILHEGFEDRALAELEAESVAYVVCASLGINSGGYTFGYVASWTGGGDEAVAAVKLAGGRIQQTANTIISAMETVDAIPSPGEVAA